MLQKIIRAFFLSSLAINFFMKAPIAMGGENDLPSLTDSAPTRVQPFYSLGIIRLEGKAAKKIIEEKPKDYYEVKEDEKKKAITVSTIEEIINKVVSRRIYVKKKTVSYLSTFNHQFIVSHYIKNFIEVMDLNGNVIKTIPFERPYQTIVYKNEIYVMQPSTNPLHSSKLGEKNNVMIISNNFEKIENIEDGAYKYGCSIKITNNKLYAGCEGKSLQIIDTANKKLSNTYKLKHKVESLEISPDGKYILACGRQYAFVSVINRLDPDEIYTELSTNQRPNKMLMHDKILYVESQEGIEVFEFGENSGFERKNILKGFYVNSMFACNKKVYFASNYNVYLMNKTNINDVHYLMHRSEVIAVPGWLPSTEVLWMVKMLKKCAGSVLFSDVSISFTE